MHGADDTSHDRHTTTVNLFSAWFLFRAFANVLGTDEKTEGLPQYDWIRRLPISDRNKRSPLLTNLDGLFKLT